MTYCTNKTVILVVKAKSIYHPALATVCDNKESHSKAMADAWPRRR